MPTEHHYSDERTANRGRGMKKKKKKEEEKEEEVSLLSAARDRKQSKI
jgi:hypothetical protein